jgi:hypothetical protein
MSQWKIRFGAVVAVLVSGCGVPSLYPLYTDKDPVFDPALIGTWSMKDGPILKFTKGPNKSYELICTDKKGSAKFETHLIRLGKNLFLDTFPIDSGLGQNEFYAIHLIPAHMFIKVDLKGNELGIKVLNPEWFKEGIEKKRFQIKYEVLSNRFLLTAPSRELQAFVTRYADEAFSSEGEVMHRVTATTTRPAGQSK